MKGQECLDYFQHEFVGQSFWWYGELLRGVPGANVFWRERAVTHESQRWKQNSVLSRSLS